MISSMTGFGKSEAIYNGRRISVEIKTVNHRYLDISVRLPLTLSFCELAIRKRAGEIFSRGKVDIFIKVETEREGDSGRQLGLNVSLLHNYYEMLRQIKEELNLPGEITLAEFTGLKDLFVPREPEADQAEIMEILIEAVDEALEATRLMRNREGESLCEAMAEALSVIEEQLGDIRVRAPVVVEEYRTRLAERIQSLAGGIALDEGRLMQEVALMADKSDITEEVDRLKSHLEQFRGLLCSSVAAGRKLDFLVQEMGREANTMGAKSNDLESSRIVIGLKSEVSKLKEQVQNIE